MEVPRATRPEGRNGVPLPQLAHQMTGDQVAGDDEEDVDTDKPGLGPAEQMVKDDHDDGEGSEPLDVEAACRCSPRGQAKTTAVNRQ
jgi:hypothetical protein